MKYISQSIAGLGQNVCNYNICSCIWFGVFLGHKIAFSSGNSGEQFDRLLSTMSQTGTSADVKTSPSEGNILDILNTHGDTLQQMALLAYLTKGEQAKPFLQATTAVKVS